MSITEEAEKCTHKKVASDMWSFKWCWNCGSIKFLANGKPVEKDVSKIEWILPERRPISRGKVD